MLKGLLAFRETTWLPKYICELPTQVPHGGISEMQSWAFPTPTEFDSSLKQDSWCFIRTFIQKKVNLAGLTAFP